MQPELTSWCPGRHLLNRQCATMQCVFFASAFVFYATSVAKQPWSAAGEDMACRHRYARWVEPDTPRMHFVCGSGLCRGMPLPLRCCHHLPLPHPKADRRVQAATAAAVRRRDGWARAWQTQRRCRLAPRLEPTVRGRQYTSRGGGGANAEHTPVLYQLTGTSTARSHHPPLALRFASTLTGASLAPELHGQHVRDGGGVDAALPRPDGACDSTAARARGGRTRGGRGVCGVGGGASGSGGVPQFPPRAPSQLPSPCASPAAADTQAGRRTNYAAARRRRRHARDVLGGGAQQCCAVL